MMSTFISDEPYRELTYGVEVPWVPAIYPNTLVCYSWSKSLSLPGDRIGYVLAPNEVHDSREVYLAVCGAGRSLGYICAPVFFQRVIERCVDEPTNVEAYAVNREILTHALDELGYEYTEPAMVRSICGSRRSNLMRRRSRTRQRNTNYCSFLRMALA